MSLLRHGVLSWAMDSRWFLISMGYDGTISDSLVLQPRHFVSSYCSRGWWNSFMVHMWQTHQTRFNNDNNSSYQLLSTSCAHEPGPVLVNVLSVLPSPIYMEAEWGCNSPKVLGFEPSRLCDSKAHILFNPLPCLPFWTCTADFFNLNSRLISVEFDLSFYWGFQHLRNSAGRVLTSSSQVCIVTSATCIQINDSDLSFPIRELLPGSHHLDLSRAQNFHQLPSSLPLNSLHLFPFCPEVIMRETIKYHLGLRDVIYIACLRCSRLTTKEWCKQWLPCFTCFHRFCV